MWRLGSSSSSNRTPEFGDRVTEPRADNRPITIGDHRIEPGRSRRFDLPVARLPTGTWESIPVALVNGRRAGPHVFLSGAIHGDELNGVEIVRRVLKHLDARKLAGAVVAVPVVNVFGFVNQSRYLPDGRDLNRSFPGSNRGSMAARLAHLFLNTVIADCQVGVDLHTAAGHRINAPQVRADLDDPETLRLAGAFGAPYVIHARVRDGSLRQAAIERGMKVLVYEAGSVQRFQEAPIAAGVSGVLRVLEALGMGSWNVPAHDAPVEIRKTAWVRATRGGIATVDVRLGETVEAGQAVATIGDALGGRPIGVKTGLTGHVIALTQNPMVSMGDALVHVAVPGAEGEDEPVDRRPRRRR
jgi:predicted deacylase